MNSTLDPVRLQMSLYRQMPLYEFIGATIVELGQPTRCRLPYNDAVINHFGAVHAGVQFTLVEMAGGLANLSCNPATLKTDTVIARAMEIEYLKPATSDVDAVVSFEDILLQEVENALWERGKSEFDLSCQLYDEGGGLVSKAVTKFFIRRSIEPPAKL